MQTKTGPQNYFNNNQLDRSVDGRAIMWLPRLQPTTRQVNKQKSILMEHQQTTTFRYFGLFFFFTLIVTIVVVVADLMGNFIVANRDVDDNTKKSMAQRAIWCNFPLLFPRSWLMLIKIVALSLMLFWSVYDRRSCVPGKLSDKFVSSKKWKRKKFLFFIISKKKWSQRKQGRRWMSRGEAGFSAMHVWGWGGAVRCGAARRQPEKRWRRKK